MDASEVLKLFYENYSLKARSLVISSETKGSRLKKKYILPYQRNVCLLTNKSNRMC